MLGKTLINNTITHISSTPYVEQQNLQARKKNAINENLTQEHSLFFCISGKKIHEPKKFTTQWSKFEQIQWRDFCQALGWG